MDERKWFRLRRRELNRGSENEEEKFLWDFSI